MFKQQLVGSAYRASKRRRIGIGAALKESVDNLPVPPFELSNAPAKRFAFWDGAEPARA